MVIFFKNWKKKAKFMAPNVLNLLSFMNATSYWAQFMILECNNLDERTATIRKLIGAAQVTTNNPFLFSNDEF